MSVRGNDEEQHTVVESVEVIRRAWQEPVAGGTVSEPLPPPEAEACFRPVIRPTVPRLTLLDDGQDVEGETIRLRDPVTLIGRGEGQVRLPHDPLVSKRHAEIVREPHGRSHRWLLRDLGSANGTFVRCTRALLRPGVALILGGRRFRFQPAGVDSAAAALVEATPAGGLELVLAGCEVVVGRGGPGTTLAVDDPLLAGRHARLTHGGDGTWRIEALPSRNGVWVEVCAVHLAPACRFLVGEQRLLFEC